MPFENVGLTAEQSAKLKEKSATEGFEPLVLEALDGMDRVGHGGPTPKPFKVNTPTEAGTPGIYDSNLHRESVDGGHITYDRAGNMTAWESKDKKTTKTFSYHDSDVDRSKLLRIDGADLYQDKNGTYFQYDTVDGVKKPVGKLVTKAYNETAFVDLRGSGESEAVFNRAVDKDKAPIVMPVEIKSNLKLSATLDMVTDNHGHVWKRDKPGKPLVEYVLDAKGREVKTKYTATDAELLPKDPYYDANQMKLYGDVTKPLDSIKAFSITQGELGDCYFMGPMSNQVAQNPQRIVDMIHDNKDGTYTVKYPLSDPTFSSKLPFDKRPTLDITVEAPTAPEMATFDQPLERGQKNGYWSAVMEKAHRYLTGKVTYDDGGQASDSIQFLSGVRKFEYLVQSENKSDEKDASGAPKSPDYNYTKRVLDSDPRKTKDYDGNANWLQEVKDALANGETVVARTPQHGNQWAKIVGGTADVNALNRSNEVGFEKDQFNIVDSHIYSVVKVDGDKITLRNPLAEVMWAPAKNSLRPFDQKDDGYFTVSSSDFQKFFPGIYIN